MHFWNVMSSATLLTTIKTIFLSNKLTLSRVIIWVFLVFFFTNFQKLQIILHLILNTKILINRCEFLPKVSEHTETSGEFFI